MLSDYHLLPHAGIRTLSPYIPGRSAETVAHQLSITDVTKLASNENPLGCSPLVTDALAKLSKHQIATYAVADQHPLREKIAHQIGVDAPCITLGNGSDALALHSQLCFALHTGKHILTHQYAFIAYGIHAQTLGIPVMTVPIRDDWQVDIDAMIATCTDQTALIFLANPNNPTGALISQPEIERLIQQIPTSTLLVLDEAYYDYVPPTLRLNTLALLSKYPNLMVTRTFSKAYGLAGLRLGYLIASLDISNILQRAMPPFSVNEAALAAGFAALDDHDFITESVDKNAEGMIQLQKGLTEIGLKHAPTAGNFITFDCNSDTTPIIHRLEQSGMIIRSLHPYGLTHHARVTIGTSTQNTRFLHQLKDALTHEQ